ncbi:hypothetical protein [Streptomyces erythrochromogenes]|uniref:hypothetical protein n=1 Tax=Streptomyces erythrochromogenes TaxID=285574 RepID=UPI003814A608
MNTSWTWAFNDHDPKRERLVEALCALGNGRFATRGAVSEASADAAHCGTARRPCSVTWRIFRAEPPVKASTSVPWPAPSTSSSG